MKKIWRVDSLNRIWGISALVLLISSAATVANLNSAKADSQIFEKTSKQELEDSSEASNLAFDLERTKDLKVVGLSLNEQERRLEVWVSPGSNKNVDSAIEDQRFLSIEIHDASHSKAELDLAIHKLNSLVTLGQIPENVMLSSSQIQDDGSGITVTFDVSSPVPSAAWPSAMAQILGVPVFVDPKPTNIKLTASRIDDYAPWRGGSLFSTTNSAGLTGYCSQGFGVQSKITNIQYMLTARHCFDSSTSLTLNKLVAPSPSIGSWSSSSAYNSSDFDVSLTFPDQGTVRNSVYYGGIASTAAIQVQGTSTNVEGALVCTDGANSGMHCDVRVIAPPQQLYVGLVVYSGVVKGQRDNGYISAAFGDSGGPVISDPTLGSSVSGFGIIHAIDDLGNCANFSTPVNLPGAHCGKVVYWMDLNSALAALHMNLKN